MKEWPTGPDDVELLVWTESEDREARGDIFWGNEVPTTHFVIFPVKGLRRRKASAARGMYPTRRMPLLMLPEPVLSPPEHHPCGTSETLSAAAECSEVSHGTAGAPQHADWVHAGGLPTCSVAIVLGWTAGLLGVARMPIADLMVCNDSGVRSDIAKD